MPWSWDASLLAVWLIWSVSSDPLADAGEHGDLTKVTQPVYVDIASGLVSEFRTTPAPWAAGNPEMEWLGTGRSDAAGRTALHWAARWGDVEVVEWLLSQQGSKPEVEAKDRVGQRALHFAAKYDHLEVVKSLVNQGADLNAQDEDGWTPLHGAAEYGLVDVVKWLQSHGADSDVQDRRGRTALHHAATTGQLKTVQWLMRHGASVHLKDWEGLTALGVAATAGRWEIVEVLANRTQMVGGREDVNALMAFQLAGKEGQWGVARRLKDRLAAGGTAVVLMEANGNCGQRPGLAELICSQNKLTNLMPGCLQDITKEAAACWLQLGGNPLAHSSSGTPYVLLLGDAATKGFWLQQVGWTSAMLHIFSSPLAWSLLLTALGLSAALLLLRGPRPCD
ncbi:Serine/threonine-protein phosphatase 6 regulatory ankyrin repeat subunit B (PP6-ARS-B) (Serine/threonine-protein phosphatase 6 regulatory subunit ARS-B) (Ankyrin repeat domain-containing protein 44), partial [Durusdinium trenchii]